jgi:hypothetical protein
MLDQNFAMEVDGPYKYAVVRKDHYVLRVLHWQCRAAPSRGGQIEIHSNSSEADTALAIVGSVTQFKAWFAMAVASKTSAK